MRSLTAYASEQEPLGFFRIFAAPPGGYQREITMFRGAPVKIGTVSTQDPFTEVTADLSLPQVTVFDAPGEGDLDWLVPDSDIDIVFQNVGGYDFGWRWEGYIASYGFSLSGSESSFNLDLKGAFYGLDDYLAIPQHPKRPIPYEILIAQAFDQTQHPAHLGKFRILFPEDWGDNDDHKVPDYTDGNRYLSALKPWGIATGKLWTGFAARNTGSWEPMLTGFVQTRLMNMFAEGGRQWSIRNRGQRRPELFLRRIPDPDDDSIIEIVLGAPGVTMDGTRDFTQRAGVLYGAGQDTAGINFSNIQVTPDGRTTYYKPFAYSPRMWPRGKSNPRYNPNVKPKETILRFEDGIDEVSAFKVAQGQYQRFSEPGITGSISLSSDPRLSSGELMPRLMIRGGQSIRIHGLFGIREGVLAHITQASADFDGMTTSLTFDTKYRDQLTVEEVRARTRDALTPMRALQVGKYSNTLQDLVLPWSYSAGSGIIPTGAKDFFNDKLPANATFPFEEWTKKWPPSNPKSKPWYIEIPKMNPDNSNKNWSAVKRNGKDVYAIPIRMSQAGGIRLSQLAAYDKDGNVLPVKFHLSVYTNNGIAVDSMPEFPGTRRIPDPDNDGETIPNPDFPKYLKARKVNGTVIPTSYETNFTMEDPPPLKPGETEPDPPRPKIKTWHKQTHPFYEGGWEKVQPDGTNFPWPLAVNSSPQEIVVGWGNYFEPAGYSPGRFSKGAARTGMLEDATPWSWDLTDSGYIDLNKPQLTDVENAGLLYIMIYCDDQGDEPVYFMGRFIRSEPGAS